MTDDEDALEVYANEPLGQRQAHLFRGQDVQDASLNDGYTEETVQSICGLVKSYGSFTDEIPAGVCESCLNIHEAFNDD